MRGLESHLSYRVGLRTFSAQESRAVLGVPDAYELPAVPGLGYLKPDPTTMLRFKAAYVSGPPTGRAPVRRDEGGHVRGILPFTVASVRPLEQEPDTAPEPVAAQPVSDVSLLDLAVRRMAGRGPAAHQVWLPPLEEPDTLDGLFGDLADDPDLGLHSPSWRALGGLTVPLGTVDRPREQRRDTLTVDLSGAAAYFREHGIDSIETYRARRREGRADDGFGDVFLVVDGWSTLRADFDDLEMELQQLAGRGLTFGLHVVAGAARWSDFRAAMRDVFGTRLELRLGDPVDSEVDRRLAALVPAGRPGRGLVQSKLHFLGALPRVDGSPRGEDLGAGVEDLLRRVADAWRGPAGPKLRLLPELIDLADVRRMAGAADGDPSEGPAQGPVGGPLLLGVDEKELAPVARDVDAEPHLLVLGDGQSGKSALLRSYVREVTRTRGAAEVQVVVVDYRRSLLGEVPEGHLLQYLTSAQQATPALRDLAAYLEQRIPGPDVTPEQLRTRSWWEGAEVFVVVDDYDLVATQQSSPLVALQPLLAQARDVGLHVVVARRSGGASRALYEPVIQTLRDLAMPGLLLSGSPDEGPLLGTLRPTPLPPGRGRLLTRARGVETVQVAWSEPSV